MVELQLSGRVVPKARPRLSRGKAPFLPKPYSDWKNEAIHQIRLQLPYNFVPIKKAAIEIEIFGQAKGDLDNLAGAVLDALVQSQALLDDRVSCVPKLLITFTPQKDSGANIKLLEIDDAKTKFKKNLETKAKKNKPIEP